MLAGSRIRFAISTEQDVAISHWLNSAMYACDATSKVFKPLAGRDKARILDHGFELFLSWELLDALNKILIAIAISSNKLSDQWNSTKAPPFVDGIKKGIIDMTELKTCEETARL